MPDLDKGGNAFEFGYIYNGPTLGWLKSGVGSGANLAQFDSQAIAQMSTVPPNVTHIQTFSYAVPYDNGGATYIRTDSNPFAFQTADGQSWVMADNVVNVAAFGTVADGFYRDGDASSNVPQHPITDNTLAIQNAIDWCYYGISTGQPGGGPWDMGLSFHITRALYFPKGIYGYRYPLFFDHPGNLRGVNSGTPSWNPASTYNGGDVVLWSPGNSGITPIPWVAQMAVPANNAPDLPRKFIFYQGYTVGDVVQWSNRYWRCIVTPPYPFRPPGQDPAPPPPDQLPSSWTQVPIYWLPTVIQPSRFQNAPPVFGEGESGPNTSILLPLYNNSYGVVLGPNENTYWSGLSIWGLFEYDPFGHRRGQPAGGIAMAIGGGSSGASRTFIRNMSISSFYVGIKTGFYSDGLCDSNTFENVDINNCGVGIWFSQTQNFVNMVRECRTAQCFTSVLADQGTGCNIYGGNHSAITGLHGNYTISGTSAVTAIPGSNNSYNYGFTTIVSSPDANIANGIFNALTLQTQNYGVIPVVPNDWTMVSNTSNTIGTGSKTFVWSFGAPFLPVVGQPVTIRDNTASLTNVMTGTVTSWTPGTNTLVVNVTSAVGSGSSSNWSIISTSYVAGTLYLRTNVEWAHFSFGQNNQVSGGDLQTEIQACTTLHCCEVPQTFVGTGLDIQGVHVEQSAGTPICFLTAGASFGSSFPCDVRHIYFNSNQNSNYGGNNDQFFAAQTFPFIYIQSCDVNLENSVTTQNYGPNGVIIDFSEDTGGYQHNLVNNWYQTTNYRIGQQIGYPTNSRQLLGGANKTPFFVSQSVNSYDVQWRQHWGFVEMLGCRPRPGTLPAILPGDITVLQGALPAITHSGSGSSITYNVPYPLMWGGHPYQTTDWYSATSATYISNHHAYTYGQNLTTTNVPNLSWRYKAGGNVVYANAELFNLLFVGLQVVLNDGVSDHTYMVIGMYPNVAAADNSFPGYFTVVGFDAINSASLLSGTPANSIKTGTLIKQEPFAIVAA